MNRYLYFISGLSLGAGAALLLAPMSGADTRSTLKDSFSERKDRIKSQVDQVRDAVNDTIERSKDAVLSTGQGMADALERGKSAFRG